jgi:hypothetical protein
VHEEAIVHVVVTIPRDAQDRVEAEERELERKLATGEQDLCYFWALSRRPVKLRIGERMYFLWDGAIRAWHKVIGFDSDMLCDHSRIQYNGVCVLLDPEIHHLSVVIHKAPFRGFQYFEGGGEDA